MSLIPGRLQSAQQRNQFTNGKRQEDDGVYTGNQPINKVSRSFFSCKGRGFHGVHKNTLHQDFQIIEGVSSQIFDPDNLGQYEVSIKFQQGIEAEKGR
jgi:hypothetical protein